jgi:predicted nuclease of predicted toxin-antitoxin system
MNIKLDENLPTVLAATLTALGHHVDTVPQEQLTGQADPLVWDAAQNAQRFLITQDLDFSDVRRFQPGTHHGLMLVRLQTPSRRRLAERIESVFRTENAVDWERCFVVVTDHKVRVRRP